MMSGQWRGNTAEPCVAFVRNAQLINQIVRVLVGHFVLILPGDVHPHEHPPRTSSTLSPGSFAARNAALNSSQRTPILAFSRVHLWLS